ncbi:MAG: geranylgeranylglyceryl/heptaprenylglyceryl phosphate synthase [Bacteroidetes bacterium]|jgi:phosphoglycerol geranylgeranyltransferase|nr:geranylgeranylglyceryl/heptaprenylglyceryl phosphate synthase [Bacteroidota bacterium]MBT3747910.1 geranylgeranylglyceryl/heptaprenylglyceryl phosphate synthase [Bacteroidota bacterium]MBT4398168.1 geranylgeranylglyceryl/heptaprenylglyceryl phosphate synthase [Bacteroidota bacterium]MBT4410031.1 geranylgeranylglyceryl/heptaprenylglyceryl phosphate synthase [Bacteroidota bacterium]MBT5425771.1 geranylgeranylglyceryl/heptaprenylglyceryl phosphate synthase [Bacteroidota bacterium]
MEEQNRKVKNHLVSLKSGKKSFALLIDPDKSDEGYLDKCVSLSAEAGVSFFLVGGSLVFKSIDPVLKYLRSKSDIPLVLFPGSVIQLSPLADAILFLSLISGRNPDYLIGNHVVAAPFLAKESIEVIPTGYMLIDGGMTTTVEYISHTKPLPANKPEIAVATALAGEMLGLQVIYMDGGSGAHNPIPPAMIEAVAKATHCPLIIGGGIRSGQQAFDAYSAGADLIVVGNRVEEQPSFLSEIKEATNQFNSQLNS